MHNVMTLPPDREVTLLVQGRYDWIGKDRAFAAAFIGKLSKAFACGMRVRVVNRAGYSIAEVPVFSGPWVVALVPRMAFENMRMGGCLPARDAPWPLLI